MVNKFYYWREVLW